MKTAAHQPSAFAVTIKNVLQKTKKWFKQFNCEHNMNEAGYKQLKRKPILYVKNLTKHYFGRKAPAINNISFNVYPGEFHAFIGANGAGKTTTIKCLIGAYYKWNGTVLINGIKNSAEAAKQKLGYIPETARFPEKFSAYNYLLWMVMLSGIKREEAKAIVEEKLKSFNMWNLRKKSPNSFSSGQKKKILLAQALVHNPDIIIMDEPVANLDPKARADFFSVLNDLKKQGKAIFISSHVLPELDAYFDSATILDGGKIVFSGSKAELEKKFNRPNYTIISDHDQKIIKYFTQNKLKYIVEPILKQIIFYPKDKNEIKQLQIFALKNNIFFDNFVKNAPTLDDVYRKLVIKGSVDTGKT